MNEEIKLTQIDVLTDNALCLSHHIQYGRDALEELCAKLAHVIRNVLPVCDYVAEVSHDRDYSDIKQQFFELQSQGMRSDPIMRYTQFMKILTQLKMHMLDLVTYLNLNSCDIDKLKMDIDYINKFLP